MREEMLGVEREGHGQSRHDQSPPFTLQEQEEKQKKGRERGEQIKYFLRLLDIVQHSVTVPVFTCAHQQYRLRS